MDTWIFFLRKTLIGCHEPSTSMWVIKTGGRVESTCAGTRQCRCRWQIADVTGFLPSIICNVLSHSAGCTVGNSRLQFQEAGIKIGWDAVVCLTSLQVSSVTSHPVALGSWGAAFDVFWAPPHSSSLWPFNGQTSALNFRAGWNFPIHSHPCHKLPIGTLNCLHGFA